LIALSEHLLKQGYKPSEITVLSTYTGQMFLIKRVNYFSFKRIALFLSYFIKQCKKWFIFYFDRKSKISTMMSSAKCMSQLLTTFRGRKTRSSCSRWYGVIQKDESASLQPKTGSALHCRELEMDSSLLETWTYWLQATPCGLL
jgi:hypothetical protein